MGSRRCCKVYYNLMKINAKTGAVVAKFACRGDGKNSNPDVNRIEPLHGTNDVIVGLPTYGSPSISEQQISRISSSGVTQWWLYGTAGIIPSPVGLRSFAVDSVGTIIYHPILGSPGSFTPGKWSGLNPNGTLKWATTFLPGNAVTRAGAGFAIVGGNSPDTYYLNSSTGATIWSASDPASNCGIVALGPSGDFLDNGCLTASPYSALRDGTSGATVTTLSFRPFNTFYHPSGFYSFGQTTGCFAATSSLSTVFSLSSIGGASLSSGIYDTCIGVDSYGNPEYYYVTPSVVGSGGTAFDFFKVDRTGTLIWAQKYSQAFAGVAYGCNLSDDGYLYVGGSWCFG